MTSPEFMAQAAQLDAAGTREAGKAPRARGGMPVHVLPEAPPTDAPLADVLAWLTLALKLPTPVDRVERYGCHVEARTVVVLADGRRITFERHRDVFDPKLLLRTVVTMTGADLLAMPQAAANAIGGAITRAGKLLAEHDDRAEARDWAQQFLDLAAPNTIEVGTIATAEGRYEALRALGTPVPSVEPYAPPAARARLVLVADTGERLARVSDVAAHVRGLTGRPVGWTALHSRLIEAGWDHRGEVEQRQPGGTGRARQHVYAIPHDLETPTSAPCPPVSPRSTRARARAGARASDLPGHEGTGGHEGTRGDTAGRGQK